MIGEWFREMGIEKITVSSVGMAQYFSHFGWQDITIAFPVNIREINVINALASKAHLGLLVMDAMTVDELGKKTNHPISLWIKIDVGTHRTGLGFQNIQAIDEILHRIDNYSHLHFSGFLAHAGHSYQKRSQAEVQVVYDESLRILLNLKSQYLSSYPYIKVSLGDTPGASMVEDFGVVDELRPGNYVFYDLMQEEIGACRFDDIAVAMACPVVAVHPERNQWVIYGGAIHFSKDFLLAGDGKKIFGRMVDSTESGWSTENVSSNPVLVSLSQEHGIVQCNKETFSLCKPGDLSLWLPVHSCLTADAIGSYSTTSGEAVDHYRGHLYE